MDIFKEFSWINIVAFLTLTIGILVKVIGLPDQIKKNYNRKSTEGQATSFWVIAWLVYLLWAYYGILKKDMVLIIGQGLGVLTTGIVLWQVFIYRKNKKPIIDENEETIKGKDYIGVGGGCLILNDKKDILLIRRAGEVRNESGWWSKPGGGVKFGETVQEAMIREMKEELNIEVKIVGYLPHTDHVIMGKRGKRSFLEEECSEVKRREECNLEGRGNRKQFEDIEHWVAFNLIAEIVSGEPKNMEPHKCDKIAWFPLDKLPEKITQTTKEPVADYLDGKFIEY